MERKEQDKTPNDQDKIIIVEIADVSGHQTLMLKPQETIEIIENNSDKWIFVDDQLVDYQNVPEVDWSQTGSVRILPGLVGGIINQY